MRNALIFFLIITIFFLLGIPIYLKINECKQCDLNYDNILKVSKNMKYNQVLSIMGKPMKIDTPSYNSDSIFKTYYETPAGMSDHISLGISMKDSTVIYINNGE